jgi:hypothetical protein
LIVTDLKHIAPDGKSAAVWILNLISPEVTTFVVEAAKASKETATTVEGWFELLRNLRRSDVPRSGMRMFVQLASLPQIGVPSFHDPWIAWLRYFIANGAVEYQPRSKNGAGELKRTFSDLLTGGSKEQQAAALILMAEALARPSSLRESLATEITALWLNSETLHTAIQSARRMKGGEHHYVQVDHHAAFWTFLYAGQINSTPPVVTIDLREVRRRAGSIVTLGFSEDSEDALPEEQRFLRIPAQAIYRAWDQRERDVERVRPFFGDEALRAKIRPLEIVRTGRTREEPPAAPPVQSTPRQTLTLTKPGAGYSGTKAGRD